MQTEAVNVSRETHKILPHNLASLGMLTLSHLNSSHGLYKILLPLFIGHTSIGKYSP